jgi:signal transduction histidine kinase
MRLAGHVIRAPPPYPECMTAGLRNQIATAVAASSGIRSRIAATVAAGVTEPPAPRSPRLRRGRVDLVFVADVVTAFILLAITSNVLGHAGLPHGATAGPFRLLLVPFMLCVPLVLRTRYPLTSWTVSALALIWASRAAAPMSVSAGKYVPAVIVSSLCLYAVAVRCKTWVVISAGAVTVLGAVFIEGQNLTTVLFIAAIPVATGLIVRTRRGGREQLEVQERRHEGERALLQERQRIARELHDVVAHHMSVIAIQAEAAPYKTENPPPELAESFAEIRASALSGLSELRRVLGVLRSETPETAPQPGLDDLPSLLESARSGGVTITSGVTGTPRPLPEGVNLSAYRIVQEALSNAMRHAPGSAVQVKLYYGDAALVVEVRNNGCPPREQGAAEEAAGTELSHGGGHGIIGMRERATMLGGNLQAGPTGKGEFLVTAALPLGDGEPENAL